MSTAIVALAVRRAIAVLLITLLFSLLGPLLTSPHGRSANAAFAYEPPDGFKRALNPDATVWFFDDPNGPTPGVQPAQVVLTQSSKEMSVEEKDLARLAEDMPAAFENCTWIQRRHELRTRADGARVGIIEGDCDHDLDLSGLGLPPKTIKQRKLQLMFPDDDGTAIVTATYATDQASRWQPLFEATIAKAKGVATRVPPPPPWMYAAWALAGLVIGWLAGALLARKTAPP